MKIKTITKEVNTKKELTEETKQNIFDLVYNTMGWKENDCVIIIL